MAFQNSYYSNINYLGVWKFTTFLAVMQCFDPKTAGEKLKYLTEYCFKVKNHGFYCHFLFIGIVFELGEWKSKIFLFHSNATCQPTVRPMINRK